MSSLELLLKQIDDPSELSWKEETYDLALARSLAGDERTAFISRLIDAARAGDPRAVLTLGYIGAVETLPALLPLAKSQAPTAATARRAVVLLGHGAEVVNEIANDAVHATAKMARVAAVMDLAKIGDAKAIATLEQALADPEFEVRELAWEGLVTALGIDRSIRSPAGKRELFTNVELISVLLGSKIAAFTRMGIEEMRAIVEQLRAGATPKSLGIAWSPNPAPELFTKIRLALFDPDAAFPIDEIARLSGVGRRWAETIIALRLEHQDVRVPDALAQLDAAWTLPALEEIAQAATTSPELRERLTQGIAALQAATPQTN